MYRTLFTVLAVALMLGVVVRGCHDEGDDVRGADDPCTKEVKQFANRLFPSNRLIKGEAWIVYFGRMVGASMPQMDREVVNYEVGRMSAMQIALGQISTMPECQKPAHDDD